MDFRGWFFEAKTRKNYEKILINLLDLDPNEGMNQKLNTLNADKLKKQIDDSGELEDLSLEKKSKIKNRIDSASSSDSINDLVSIMAENHNFK
jgi:DNA primase